MPIPTTGFCLLVQRLKQEKRTSKAYPRTVGNYACYWNGSPITALTGQMVERGGPGDNTTAVGNVMDLRIAAGTYPLAVHSGTKYKTLGYSPSLSHTALPRPGILLKQTGERSAILIHPGMDYVWSVGCLNPASGLVNANSAISFTDSRGRVIAIIDAIRSRLGASFPTSAGKTIPGAVVVIEGEP